MTRPVEKNNLKFNIEKSLNQKAAYSDLNFSTIQTIFYNLNSARAKKLLLHFTKERSFLYTNGDFCDIITTHRKSTIH